MEHQIDEERLARIRQARQVLAGSDVYAPDEPADQGGDNGLFDPLQLRYLLGLGVLLVIGLLLLIVSSLAASIVLFVLALALLAGWVIF